MKIGDLIRSVNKNSDDYDEKYMKIKFNSDDELPSMIIAVRAIFLKINRYYPQVFLEECLYEL